MNEEDLYQIVYMQSKCPQCGGKVEELDKDTSSGRDVRYYKCYACGWSDFVDVGIALWKALSSYKDGE